MKRRRGCSCGWWAGYNLFIRAQHTLNIVVFFHKYNPRCINRTNILGVEEEAVIIVYLLCIQRRSNSSAAQIKERVSSKFFFFVPRNWECFSAASYQHTHTHKDTLSQLSPRGPAFRWWKPLLCLWLNIGQMSHSQPPGELITQTKHTHSRRREAETHTHTGTQTKSTCILKTVLNTVLELLTSAAFNIMF